MKRIEARWKLSALSCALFTFMSPTWAADRITTTTTTTQGENADTNTTE